MRAVNSNKKYVEVQVECDGDQVRLRVLDEGPGIPEEDLERVFDLFYSTKEVGKGTGLGLSVAHHIVEQHHMLQKAAYFVKGKSLAIRLASGQTACWIFSNFVLIMWSEVLRRGAPPASSLAPWSLPGAFPEPP